MHDHRLKEKWSVTMILDNEYVVLVDEADREIGVEKKIKGSFFTYPSTPGFFNFFI